MGRLLDGNVPNAVSGFVISEPNPNPPLATWHDQKGAEVPMVQDGTVLGPDGRPIPPADQPDPVIDRIKREMGGQ